MMKKMKKVFAVLVAAILCLTFIDSATALDKETAVKKVKTAFEKQVSLSEKPRSMEEIDAIMNTHFTEDFKKKFVLENVIETDEGFQTFGSDFAPHYIPNFQYGEEMKLIQKNEAVYLYEYITYEEGPVFFEDGYQAVKLVKDNGDLKIEEIFYTLPEELEDIKSGEEEPQALDSEKNLTETTETARGEDKATSLLPLSYWNKLYLIFQGFFIDEELGMMNITA